MGSDKHTYKINDNLNNYTYYYSIEVMVAHIAYPCFALVNWDWNINRFIKLGT